MRNKHLVGSALTPLLVRLALGPRPRGGVPIVVDQTLVQLGAACLALGRVPYRQGAAVQYAQVAYQQTQREPVDIIVFHDPAFQEPWYLLVPPGSHRQLPTDTVVALYRQRMHAVCPP